MKGVISWLVRWACRAGTRDIGSPLATLVGTVQNNHRALFQYLCPHRPASWAGSRAGSPGQNLIKICV